MQKGIIIYGPARVEKIRLAKDIAGTKNRLWFNGLSFFRSRSNFKLQKLTAETEVIIFHNIQIKKVKHAIAEFANSTISFYKKGIPTFFTIPKPKVILTVESGEFKCPDDASTTARFDFIRLESTDDYYREYERLLGHPHPETL